MAESVAWVVPTVGDIQDALAGAAIEAFRTKALASGQTDPFADSMHNITTRIRAEIANKQSISLTPYAIPPSTMWIASLMIVEFMQGRLPGVYLTDKQQKMLDDARNYLRRINEGKIQVEFPTDPAGTEFQTGSPIEVVTYTTPRYTRAQMDGL